jgi:hypothetical protein
LTECSPIDLEKIGDASTPSGPFMADLIAYVSLLFSISNQRHLSGKVLFIHAIKGWLSALLLYSFWAGVPIGAVLKIRVSGIFANTCDKKYRNSPWAKVMNSNRTKACTNATNVNFMNILTSMP